MSDQPSPDPPLPRSRSGRVDHDDDLELDLKVDFLEIVNRPRHREPRHPGPETAPDAGETATPLPPVEKGPHGNRVPLYRKTGIGTQPFTRFVTRPETSVAATAASVQPQPGRGGNGSLPVPGASLGKTRPGDEVGYSPNRLQEVMNEAYAHSPVTWINHMGRLRIGLLMLAIAGVAGALVWQFGVEVRRQQAGQEVAPAVNPSMDQGLRQAGIRRAFDAYLTAPGISEKLPFIVDAQRVNARMMDFYEARGERDPKVASYEVGPPVRAAGDWWFTLHCVAPKGESFTVRMKETPGGGQLDWENFVAYGSMDWEQFLTSKPTAPQSLRAQVRPSSQYTGKYGEKDYLAYEISHRRGSESIHGYVLRASRAGQQLADWVAGEQWQSANLYLGWEPDAGAPGAVVIADVIRNNWLDGMQGGAAASKAAKPELRAVQKNP